jgi:hypothetical protein
MTFVFAIIAAWLAYVWLAKEWKGDTAFSFLFYGLFIHCIAISSSGGWQQLDEYRSCAANDEPYTQGLDAFTVKECKGMLGGLIVNYIGLFLALIAVHGKFSFKLSVALYLLIGASVLAIIGSIILWNIDAAKRGNSNYDDFLGNSFDISTSIYTSLLTCSPSASLTGLLILSGSVLFNRVDGACAAVFALTASSIWILSDTFEYKGKLQEACTMIVRHQLLCLQRTRTVILTRHWLEESCAGLRPGSALPPPTLPLHLLGRSNFDSVEFMIPAQKYPKLIFPVPIIYHESASHWRGRACHRSTFVGSLSSL